MAIEPYRIRQTRPLANQENDVDTQFLDRKDAGQQLGKALQTRYGNRNDVRVFGLPRGGVPVAYEVARALQAPLDVFVVRKLGLPGHEEYAMGAIASGGMAVLNPSVVHATGLSRSAIDAVVAAERAELVRRETLYRGNRPDPDLKDRTVILVDDGLATGSTMHAAVAAVRQQKPKAVVVAVPVSAADTCEDFRNEVDDVICLKTPRAFRAVGLWYINFSQTSDAEVIDLLQRAHQRSAIDFSKPQTSEGTPMAQAPESPSPATSTSPEHAEAGEHDVRIPAGAVTLEGALGLPEVPAQGVVLFAHGSGSGRFSPRNRAVAQVLQRAGMATLLVDLLTREEELIDLRTRHLRFDISLLAHRLSEAIDWLHEFPATAGLPIGLFGASTGAGAALVTAAQRPDAVAAVVSRGGRPDLAGAALASVRAPTLLIVGGADETVIKLNRQARRQLHGITRLEIIPGATHLFEEPGTLEQVATLASDWFSHHLGSTAAISMTGAQRGATSGASPPRG